LFHPQQESERKKKPNEEGKTSFCEKTGRVSEERIGR